MTANTLMVPVCDQAARLANKVYQRRSRILRCNFGLENCSNISHWLDVHEDSAPQEATRAGKITLTGDDPIPEGHMHARQDLHEGALDRWIWSDKGESVPFEEGYAADPGSIQPCQTRY